MYSDTCVILAAGKGERMGGDIPKTMIEVAGKPIIQHIIEYWIGQGVTDFIFVLGHKYQTVLDFLQTSGLDAWTFVIQPELRGIANAILQTEKIVPEKFIVALGDCLNVGEFDPLPSDMIQGYSYWKDEYQEAINSGCVVIKDWRGNLVDIEEKPNVPSPGMGVYWFDKRVFNYIRNTSLSTKRNESEISDVIKNMLRAGELIKTIGFNGTIVNCTYPRDIEAAEKIIRKNAEVLNGT